ncbi:hypothetical protein MW887_005589 [Aspergillus wentii]|nr:hypothetical protein MW887_005589 [Aspergillus wentii]
MPSNKYGVIGATFQVARIFQACSLIAVIGMTANFIAEIVSSSANPPGVFIGTLSVTCIAVIYCAISFILFLDDILPFLACAIMDGLFLIAVIVVAVIIGRPLSYLRCDVIANITGENSTAYAFATNLDSYLAHIGGKVNYKNWIGASRGVCLEAKSIWGLSIALWLVLNLVLHGV